MSKVSATLVVGLVNVVGIGAVAVYVGSPKDWTAMGLCGAAFVVAVTLPFFLVRKSSWQGAVGLGAAGTAAAYLALSTGLWMLKLEDPTPLSLFTGALLSACVGVVTGLTCRISVKLQLRRLARQNLHVQGAEPATPGSQPLPVLPPGSCAPGQCVARPGPCAHGQCVARPRTQPQAGVPAADEPGLPLLRASAANQYRHLGAGVTASGT